MLAEFAALNPLLAPNSGNPSSPDRNPPQPGLQPDVCKVLYRKKLLAACRPSTLTAPHCAESCPGTLPFGLTAPLRGLSPCFGTRRHTAASLRRPGLQPQASDVQDFLEKSGHARSKPLFSPFRPLAPAAPLQCCRLSASPDSSTLSIKRPLPLLNVSCNTRLRLPGEPPPGLEAVSTTLSH